MAQSESPVIVPQQTKLSLIKAEITVLKAHLEDCQRLTRSGCTTNLARKLQSHSSNMNKSQIQQETGETPGSEGMIVKWPEATKTVLAGLLTEVKEGAKVVAEKWNNEAAPPDIQASVAEGKGADMIEHFATEMFKQAGMRVFGMSAWQNSRGKLISQVHWRHDFNEQFAGSESFLKTRDWDGIFMPEWQQYAGDQFNVQDEDVPQIVTSKKRVPWKLLELEEDNDGWPMLPDTMGWKRGINNMSFNLSSPSITINFESHSQYQQILISTGMCMGTDKVKMVVPWGDLVKNQSDFFDSTYCPANVQLVEPSKMNKADATTLFYFWHHRQQKKLCPTFCFKAWKDSDGDMEMLAKSFLKALQ
ncbi:hypothetical protein F4604DRAFT_1936734 [Suillus subluteus]|nr:hypothetical protein F4604DRAFT_1936734 [Suillus subluteus]